MRNLENYKRWVVKNREKRNEQARKRYKKNSETIRANWRKYYYKTREIRLEKMAIWKKRNQDIVLKSKINYRKNNKDKILEYSQQYYWKNKQRILEKHRPYLKKYQKEHPEKHHIANLKHLRKCGYPLKMDPYSYKFALKSWGLIIRKSFNNQCQTCSSQAEISHHILHKSKYPALSLNVNNGIALCKKCHNEVHGWKIIIGKT